MFPKVPTLVLILLTQKKDDSSFTGHLRDPTSVYSETAREQAKSSSDFVVAIEMTSLAVNPAVSVARDPVAIQKDLLKDLKAKHMMTTDASSTEHYTVAT